MIHIILQERTIGAMSGQRSKKVRIGLSRHKEQNLSKKSEADDGIHNTDGLPVAQYHTAEESIESFGDLTELNSYKSGNQDLPSSYITGNRRKLGSSRRNRGRQDVKDSNAKSYHETREEVVENTTCREALFGNRSKSPPGCFEIESASNQSLDFVEPDPSYKEVENQSDERTPETTYILSTDKVTVSVSHLPQNMENLPKQSDIIREEKIELNDKTVEERKIMLDEETLQDESKCKMSTLATEKLSQEEMSQGSERDITVSSRHDTSVYSPSTPDQSFEFGILTEPNCPEVFPEGLIPRSEEVVVDDNRVENEDKLEASDLCKSAEIYFEEMGEFHTCASKGVDDYVRDTEQLNGTSKLFNFISDPTPSTDQLIYQSKSRENPEDEALRGVHAVLGKEEERKGAMEWLKPSGNIKANYLMSESTMKVEDTESPVQEKNSPIEHNQPECIVEPGPSHDSTEQSDFTLRTEEPLKETRHNEHFKLYQATDTKLFAQLHQSGDTVNYKVAEQEVYEQTQMRKINSIHNFDESVLHAAAEHLDVPCAELIEDSNVGIRETCQSEIIMKSVDQPVNEEILYSDKQDKDPTKQSNREVSSQRNEDEYVHGSTEPRSNKIGRTDTTLDQGYDNEGQLGIDREGIVEDLVNQEGDTLQWKSEDSASSLQTLSSYRSLCSDERTRTSDSAGKKRKMASTRRNGGRQIQKSTDERLKEHEDVDVGKEAVWGGDKNELEKFVEFQIEHNSQSNTTFCAKTKEPLYEGDIAAFCESSQISHIDSLEDTLDLLDQEVSQDQNMESISSDTLAAREEAYLKQTKEVKERLVDFMVADLIEIRSKHDMEEEGQMNAEVVSEKDEVGKQFVDGKKEDHLAQEMDISYEDTYSQSLPAARNKDFKEIFHDDLKEIVTNPEVPGPQPSWMSDAHDTLQSQQDTLDRPEQNSDNDENTHIKSNSTGKMRKMGSTRRNLRYRHEEKNTDNMQNETSLMQLIQEKRGGMTTEVNSSLERDDPIKSTERVSEDEKEKSLKGKLENRNEFTRYEESEIMEFPQSQIMLFHKEDYSQTSAIQNVSYHDDREKINSRTDTLDVLNQEDFHDQNMESISGETPAVREVIHMEQTHENEVTETLEDFKVSDLIETVPKYDTKVEGLMDAQVVSEKGEVGEQSGDPAKEDHIAQDINEDTYSQAVPAAQNENVLSHTLDTLDFMEPAVHVFEQLLTSDADTSDVHQSQKYTLDRPEQTKDYNENGHVKFKSTRMKRKLGSSRRVPRSPRSGKKDGEMEKKQEDKRVEADFNTEVDMNTQVSFEAELKMLDEPKYTASDEHKPLEERKIDSAANISSASYVSTQAFNQLQNITGNLDMFHMGSNTNIFNPNNDLMELTIEVEPFENASNEEIRGCSLPALKSEVINRNNEEVTDEPKTARRRKMGSTRRNLLDGKNVEMTERLKDKREVVEKLEVTEVANLSGAEKAERPLSPVYIPNDLTKEEEKGQQETTGVITGQYHGQDQFLKASDLLNIDLESNKESSMADSVALLSEEAGNTSHSEDVGNHALFIQDSEIHDGGVIVDYPMALSLITTEMHTPTTVFESNNNPPNQLLQSSPNSEDYINTDPSIKGRRRKMASSCRTARGAQKVEKRSEKVVVQDQEVTKEEAQELKSEETSDIEMSDLEIVMSEDNGGAREGDENALIHISGSFSCSNTSLMQENNVSEGADNTKSDIETRQESNITSRRRKMGSTRRNLRVKPEEENLNVSQEAGTEVSEILKDVEDATLAEHAFDMEKMYSQLNVKLTDNDSEEQGEKLFEAVTEFSHIPCASHFIPMAHQSYLESKENPVIDAQVVNPSYLPSKSSPSPKNDVHSEVKIKGRRRKMGSTRKLQGGEIKEAGMKSITEESVIKTSEDQREESKGLVEKTEVRNEERTYCSVVRQSM